MLLINTILADVKDIDSCKQIRAFDLKELGYIISKKKIHLCKTDYEVREILDGDTQRPASFSFLFSRSLLTGIILPKEYHRYLIVAGEELNSKAYEKKNSKKEGKRSPRKPEDL